MADFFDKLADSLDKGIKTVSAKGKQFMETQRLHSDLSDAKNGIKVKYQQLGEKVFEMGKNGAIDIEELRPDMDAISGDYKRIAELETEIKELETKSVSETERQPEDEGQPVTICAECNASNPQGAKFCARCGKPVAEAAPVPAHEPVCG
jgi:hypothetical protein